MEHNASFAFKFGFEIWTLGIDPKFQHPTRAMETLGDEAVTLAFTDISNIDNKIIRMVGLHHHIGNGLLGNHVRRLLN
jgi:hypothetical protein